MSNLTQLNVYVSRRMTPLTERDRGLRPEIPDWSLVDRAGMPAWSAFKFKDFSQALASPTG